VPDEPLVSVLLCVYNGEPLLAPTLDSVLAQTWHHFELIVIDDGSTDGSGDVLGRYLDPRLRVYHQENLGPGAALAAALEKASGEFIAFLDQDDLWHPEKLAAHIGLHQRHLDIDMSFSWFVLIDECGREIGLRSQRYRGRIGFRGLLEDFVIGATSNVVVRRAAINEAGAPDIAFRRFYDLELCLRIARLRPDNVEAIPRDLMFYRRRSGQITRDIDGLRLEWSQVLEKLERIAPLDMAAAGALARSNMNRYFARLAYENNRFADGLHLLGRAFSASPLHFVTDFRNALTAAACLAGLLLPRRAHRQLESWAGLHRQSPWP